MANRLSKSSAQAKQALKAQGRKIRKQIQKIETQAMGRAKAGLDQVLLGLQHKGIDLKGMDMKDPQDVIHTVAVKVLERAEQMREQLAANKHAPEWLKDLSVVRKQFEAKAAKSAASKAKNSDKSSAAKTPVQENMETSGTVVETADLAKASSKKAKGAKAPVSDVAAAKSAKAAKAKKAKSERTLHS